MTMNRRWRRLTPMWWVAWLLFGAVMVAVGVVSARRLRGYDGYLTAGRTHGPAGIALSIAATAIGATATVGLMDQAARRGWSAFWFMAAAALGLAVQGVTVASRIRESGVRTFGELVERFLGRSFQIAVSILILFGWTWIVAAQFKAAGELAAVWGGAGTFRTGAGLAALFILAYTLPAGQRAVIATDAIQWLLLVSGVLVAAGVSSRLPLIGERMTSAASAHAFGGREVLHHLLVIGGLYVLSPNLVSRSVAARDGSSARWGALVAAPMLAAVGGVVVWTGSRAAAGGVVPPIFPELLRQAGEIWKWGLGIGILAAIVSSADTTLLVTASIAQNDLVRRPSVTGVRLWEAGIALGALVLVLLAPKATLFDFLFVAYEMFTPAAVPLLAVALYARRGVEPVLAWGAFGIGALAGLYGPAAALARRLGLGSDWPARESVVTIGFLVALLLAGLGAWRAMRRAP